MGSFRTGMEEFLAVAGARRRGARIGLVSHPAAVNRGGVSSVDLLAADDRFRLAALFGPEHGFWGVGGAGEPVADARHPVLGIPVHSLYGETRRPTAAMLEGLDLLLFDLQDLGVRCYTYVATLRHAMEAAVAAGLPFVVADRPVPLPEVVDGPMLDADCESFVGAVPAPFVYGMTPGETALWLQRRLRLGGEVSVVPMRGYRREPSRAPAWPPWVPPSPGIRSWESAQCYPATVFTEALPAFDCGRTGPLPFQVLAFRPLRGRALFDLLRPLDLPGAGVHFHRFRAGDETLDGVRLAVADPSALRPAAIAVRVLAAVRDAAGAGALWEARGARPGFFDQLLGTAAVRQSLAAGADAGAAMSGWSAASRRFRSEREDVRLYARRPR